MTSSLMQGDASDSPVKSLGERHLGFISRAFVSSCITQAPLPLPFTCSAKRLENQPWRGAQGGAVGQHRLLQCWELPLPHGSSGQC